jgi:hypothetical protein
MFKNGVFILAGSGRELVIDCVTGKQIPKEKARYVGQGKDGRHYWINQNESLLVGMKAIPSYEEKSNANINT